MPEIFHDLIFDYTLRTVALGLGALGLVSRCAWVTRYCVSRVWWVMQFRMPPFPVSRWLFFNRQQTS